MVTVALHWNWPRFAAMLLLMFSGLLRVGESLGTLVEDLSFARPPAAVPHTLLYVRLRTPKTRMTWARRQHARIDEQLCVHFLQLLVAALPSRQRLWTLGYNEFVKRHRIILRVLGIPVEGPMAITPASHRAGGATFYYQLYEDIPWLAWRGRWATTKSLEHYIQEIAAINLWAHVDAMATARIERLAKASEDALRCYFS